MTMPTSAAVAALFDANTGFRSISEISGKSPISCDTFWMSAASASRSTGSAPRTPLRISAALMLSSMDSASSQLAAQAEGDQLAEARIGDRADDDLLAAGEHLLYLDAVDLGRGFVLLGVG